MVSSKTIFSFLLGLRDAEALPLRPTAVCLGLAMVVEGKGEEKMGVRRGGDQMQKWSETGTSRAHCAEVGAVAEAVGLPPVTMPFALVFLMSIYVHNT